MSDLISRQAAIDALADMHCKSDEDGYVWIIRSDAWARIDALPSVQPEPCEDARADVYYLAEKIGIHRLYALVVELRGEPEPCEDAVPRTSVEYICRKNTVSTNPYEHKYHDKFIQFMDDPEISDFGRWQHSNGFNTALVAVKCDLDKVPSVTPKQKRGKWGEKAVSDEKVIDEWQSARCSACGKYHTAPYMYYFNNYNYCPNCGADMRGEQDENRGERNQYRSRCKGTAGEPFREEGDK